MKFKNFDLEVQVRTWVMGALAALYAKKVGFLSDAEAALVGGFVGAGYDLAVYRLKVWWAARKSGGEGPEGE